MSLDKAIGDDFMEKIPDIKQTNYKGSFKQYLDWDSDTLNKKSRAELAQVVGKFRDVAHKRIKRIQAADLTSHAYNKLLDRGIDHFSTKGKNLNQLRSQYVLLNNFLTSKSSSVSGIREIRKNVEESLEKEGIHIPKDMYEDFWKNYEKYQELYGDTFTRSKYKYQVLEMLSVRMESGKKVTPQFFNKIKQNIDKLYQADAMEENERLKDIIKSEVGDIPDWWI